MIDSASTCFKRSKREVDKWTAVVCTLETKLEEKVSEVESLQVQVDELKKDNLCLQEESLMSAKKLLCAQEEADASMRRHLMALLEQAYNETDDDELEDLYNKIKVARTSEASSELVMNVLTEAMQRLQKLEGLEAHWQSAVNELRKLHERFAASAPGEEGYHKLVNELGELVKTCARSLETKKYNNKTEVHCLRLFLRGLPFSVCLAGR